MAVQICSRSDITRYITLIRLNFENAYPTRNDDEMSLLVESWYAILKLYPREVVNEAVMRTLKHARFAPRIGDIVETVEKMRASFEKSDNELWNELKKALPTARNLAYAFQFTLIEGNGFTQGYNARVKFNDLYEGLSPELKYYLRSPGGLKELSDYDDEQLSYERGRFFRIMPQVREHERTRQELPANVARLIEDIVGKLQANNTQLLEKPGEEDT